MLAQELSRTPTDGCLQGKTCVVLGGGSDTQGTPGWAIGKAIAVAYARAGASVVVVDIDAAAAAATAVFISAEGGKAISCAADVCNTDSMRGVIATALTAFGAIHVLHNNVGIGKSGPSDGTSSEDWQRIFDVNLLSLHVATQCVVPEMQRHGSGVILSTSSVASLRHVGVPHLAYGVSKAAANHFCKMAAVEYGALGIRFNAIVVGLMDTPRIRKTMLSSYGSNESEMIARRNAQVPLGIMGDAWDVANAAVFLASDRARYITGTELVVDGAFSSTTRNQ